MEQCAVRYKKVGARSRRSVREGMGEVGEGRRRRHLVEPPSPAQRASYIRRHLHDCIYTRGARNVVRFHKRHIHWSDVGTGLKVLFWHLVRAICCAYIFANFCLVKSPLFAFEGVLIVVRNTPPLLSCMWNRDFLGCLEDMELGIFVEFLSWDWEMCAIQGTTWVRGNHTSF